MILPRILIIDDQYARNSSFERDSLITDAGILEMRLDNADPVLAQTNNNNDTIAAAAFCSGQREASGMIINDYEVIKKAVQQGLSESGKYRWNLILLDVRFDSNPIKDEDDKFGEEVRKRLKHDFSGLPLVMLSGKGEKDIENSKTPYLSKEGLDQRELTKCLLKYGRLAQEQMRSLLKLDDETIAISPSMLDVYCTAYSYAATDESVLILGDTGTGKEKVAEYIHRVSPRHAGPFITINIAAIPDTLLENELFGVIPDLPGFHHKKGKTGLFESANGGTLFLDEIGDMPLSSQAKVLRALQERRIRRVGETTEKSLNIRVLSATCRNLSQKIEKGEFLSDLLYRIGTLPVNIPPLKDHPEDIIPLAEGLLRRTSLQQNKSGITLSKDAKQFLENYPFDKNNVRELENLVKLLVNAKGNNSEISSQNITTALKISPQVGKEQTIEKFTQEKAQKECSIPVTLQNLAEFMDRLPINKDDPALKGAKKRLDAVFKSLMKRMAGAVLERSRKPGNGQLILSQAMILLTGDETLKTSDPKRLINEILEKNKTHKDKPSVKELEALVELWKEGNKKSAE